jgi:hypothetical protein
MNRIELAHYAADIFLVLCCDYGVSKVVSNSFCRRHPETR